MESNSQDRNLPATLRLPGTMLDRLQDMAIWGLIGSAAFASAIIVAVVLSNVAVGGWVNSSKPLVPDISRLNPLTGFGRLFTKDKLAEVGKMLLIVIVGVSIDQLIFAPFERRVRERWGLA